MSLKFLVLISTLLWRHLVLAESDCPIVSTVENFNVTAYLGKWYEQEKYPILTETFGSCIYTDYYQEDGTTRFKNNELLFNLLPLSIGGTVSVNSTSGLLLITPDYKKTKHVPYYVLDTDYETFAAVWTCRENSTRGAWILTRERTPLESAVENGRSALDRENLSLEELRKTDQKDCKN
ncbi:unnamed protein product [Phyllotreta striolata]|uniref:Lipocalin/cytosolic fatty-acid binding domain-containing protein n=1 Tax=Phyllotreta striolata TaxID=444603 RepID=A0A9N9TJU8_PHYSR|nr:unnamed protein product [Phyllotreta striolata]